MDLQQGSARRIWSRLCHIRIVTLSHKQSSPTKSQSQSRDPQQPPLSQPRKLASMAGKRKRLDNPGGGGEPHTSRQNWTNSKPSPALNEPLLLPTSPHKGSSWTQPRFKRPARPPLANPTFTSDPPTILSRRKLKMTQSAGKTDKGVSHEAGEEGRVGEKEKSSNERANRGWEDRQERWWTRERSHVDDNNDDDHGKP